MKRDMSVGSCLGKLGIEPDVAAMHPIEKLAVE